LHSTFQIYHITKTINFSLKYASTIYETKILNSLHSIFQICHITNDFQKNLRKHSRSTFAIHQTIQKVWALCIQVSKNCHITNLSTYLHPKISLCYLPNNSKALSTLHSSFQICHIIKHSPKYHKNHSKVASPFTIQIKDFEHSTFTFPNLQHYKPLTIVFQKPFKFCLYHGPNYSKI